MSNNSAKAAAALALTLSACLAGGAHGQEAPPPDGVPGRCYGRVQLAPATVREGAGRVLVSPARVERRRVPAHDVWTVRRTLVGLGPPVRVAVPAVWRLETRRTLLAPARVVWRRKAQPGFAYDVPRPGVQALEPTGEVLCRVVQPARWRVEHRRVLLRPARVELRPGRPLYRIERVRTRVAARVELVRIPAVWRETAGLARVQARAGWAEVLCQGAVTPAFLARVQASLLARGYDPGAPDGAARAETFAALRRFQHDRGLGEGQLTVETARALGLL